MRGIFDSEDLSLQHFRFIQQENEAAFLGTVNSCLRKRVALRVQHWITGRLDNAFILGDGSGTDIPDIDGFVKGLLERRRGYETIVRSERRRLLMEMIENRDKVNGLSTSDFFAKSNFLDCELSEKQYQALKACSPDELDLRIRFRSALRRARFSTLAELALASQEDVAITTGLDENQVRQIGEALALFI